MPHPIEEVAAKGAGKAAGVRAHVQGLTGIFNTLAQQHQEIFVLLERAQAAEGPAQRRDLWLEAQRELVSHERAELSTVFPMLEDNPSTLDIARRHAEDAQRLEDAVSQVDAVEYASSNWPEVLESLTSLFRRHVEEEERELFPRAQDVIGTDAARALEAPFAAARQQFMAELG